MSPQSQAPFPAPPDVEPLDDTDRLTPVTFRERRFNGGSLLMLEAIAIGEIRPDPRASHHYSYRLNLPDVRGGWSRPLPLRQAQDAIVSTVRAWIDGSGIAAYVRTREMLRGSGDRSGRAK